MRRVRLLLLTGVVVLAGSIYASAASASNVLALADINASSVTVCVTVKGDNKGADAAETQNYFIRHGRYTAGTATHYSPSVLTAEADHQHLAKGLVIGTRFHSAPVIRLADAKPVHLGHVAKADGRFRIFVFAGAGDPAASSSPVRSLCDFLNESPKSPVRRYTPAGADIDSSRGRRDRLQY